MQFLFEAVAELYLQAHLAPSTHKNNYFIPGHVGFSYFFNHWDIYGKWEISTFHYKGDLVTRKPKDALPARLNLVGMS